MENEEAPNREASNSNPPATGNNETIVSGDRISGNKIANTLSGVIINGLDRARQAIDPNGINDAVFLKDLQQIKNLRSFLIKEAVPIDRQDGLAFGGLNSLHFSPIGRPPTQDEWTQVERHTQSLFQIMTEPLRRKFTLGEIPSWISYLPVVFALLAAASLMSAILLPQILGTEHRIRAYVLPFYLVWLLSLGAIGAIAFIGMNILSVQEDVTFDLTNKRLVSLRIALGALFGLVLTLPFGFEGFVQFLDAVVMGQKEPTQPSQIDVTTQAIMLLLPFILGFSTSLVILILNRLVEAVQGFFGKPASTDRQTTSATISISKEKRVVP